MNRRTPPRRFAPPLLDEEGKPGETLSSMVFLSYCFQKSQMCAYFL